MPHDLQEEWAGMSADAAFISPEQAQRKLDTFERKIARRNWIEYTAGAITGPFFAFYAWTSFTDGEVRLGLGWIAMLAGIILCLINLHRYGSNAPNDPAQSVLSNLRSQMQRQRDALASIARWYVGPLLPGLVWVMIARTSQSDSNGDASIAIPVAIILFTSAILAGILFINRRAARKLSREIDMLDELA